MIFFSTTFSRLPRKVFLTFLLMLLFFIFRGSPLLAKTLYVNFDDCVEMALRNNDQIRSTSSEITSSEAKFEQAHPKGIPVLKYEYKVGPAPRNIDDVAGSFIDGDISVFNQFKVEAGTPLTTFGKLKTAQDLAQLGINASWFKKEKTTNEVVGKMYQVYQGVLLARELKKLASEAQKALKEKVSDLQNEKIQDQIQILKLKVAIFEIDRRVEEADKKEILAIEALKFQMGVGPDYQLDLRDKALVPVKFSVKGINYYLDTAREYLPEYKLLTTGVRAKEKQLALQKLDVTPDLGVGGFFDMGRTPGIRGAGDENNFTNPFNFTKAGIGFQLQGKFDYVKNKTLTKQNEADLLKTIFEKRAAVGALELEIKKIYQEVLESRTLMQKAQEEIKIARQLAFLTKSNVDLGIGEKKDYYDSLQSYLVFQGRSFESVFNYNVAVANLKQKIGLFHEYQNGTRPLIVTESAK